MKFLCEHCKAKYQIADEKVAGRTVRMTCRKCGGAIEVRAAVTETSVNAKAANLAGTDAPKKPAPARTPPPRATPLATSLAQSPRAPAHPKPASKEGHLAGAMQRNMQQREEENPAGLDLRELSAADEWYVAVNGVPVGPVRIGEVRRKAAMGAVTEDSLCWQEGMEEWRAVRTVTELAAVVREAASGGRGSLISPEPRTSPAPGPSRQPPPRASGQHPSAPRAPAAPAWATRSEMSSPAPRRPLDSIDEDAAPTMVGRSPFLDGDFGAPPPNGASAPVADPFKAHASDPFKPAAPMFAAPAVAQPAPLAPAPFAPAPVAASPASVAPPIVIAAPRRTSPIVIGMVVMFGCFGVTAAYLVLSGRNQPVVIAVPAAPTAAAPPPSAAAPTPTDLPAPVAATPSAAPVADTSAKVASAAPQRAGGTAAPAGATKPGNTAVADPALRDLIASTGNGPAAAPGAGSTGGGGAQLTEDDTRAVVMSHQTQLKRTCWEKSGSTTPSVNETVHILVGGSGQVQSATATGNDQVVGHCLEEEIKRWHWPGGGEVNVPFHFLRQ